MSRLRTNMLVKSQKDIQQACVLLAMLGEHRSGDIELACADFLSWYDDMDRIRAPFSGVVARRYIRQGQGVAKGEKSFHVSQMSPLLVVFAIPESAGAAPRIGEKLNVMAGTSNGSYAARITKISPTIDPASGAYEATAELSGTNLGSLRPGMAARVMWPPTSVGVSHH